MCGYTRDENASQWQIPRKCVTLMNKRQRMSVTHTQRAVAPKY
jgi:hypothetical protein